MTGVGSSSGQNACGDAPAVYAAVNRDSNPLTSASVLEADLKAFPPYSGRNRLYGQDASATGQGGSR